jgi:hypothetical protein
MNIEKPITQMLHFFAVCLMLMCFALNAQTLREDASLSDKAEGAPGATKLKAGSTVKVLKRQGFWVEVDAGGKNGWLKASQLNFTGATGGPTAIDTGRLGTGNIVATSAARGLSAKDLVSGKPNFEEVKKLDALSFDPAGIDSFVVLGGVVPSKEKIQLAAAKPAAPAAAAPSPNGATQAPATKKKDDDEW